MKKITKMGVIFKVACTLLILCALISCETRTKITIVKEMSLDARTLSLALDGSHSYSVTILPENASSHIIKWSSSDEKIAIVSPEGTVTAVAEGFAVITAKVEGTDVKATSDVIVGYGDETNVYTIASVEEWDYAIKEVQNNGNDKSYLFNIVADFNVDGREWDDFIFRNLTGINVVINGNHTMSVSSSGLILNVNSNQNVIIHDMILEGSENKELEAGLVGIDGPNATLTLQGNASIRNSKTFGILVHDSGVFIMKDNSSVTQNVTAVIVIDATFYMYEGSISKNVQDQNKSDCSGVELYRSTFIMYDGLITENIAPRSAGVLVDKSSNFRMLGGTISLNDGDAAVYVVSNSSFTMEGGSISENLYRGVSIGGNGIFNLYEGNISNNAGTGGGVLMTHGTFNMYGGSISGTKKQMNSFGGGLYMSDGLFNMHGGVIYGNEESGVPGELANTSYYEGAAFYHQPEKPINAKYSDGTDILPHTDGQNNYTDFTIIGR